MELSVILVFVAGLVSFISPCVLPLVPAYIGYMGGRVTYSIAVSTANGSAVAKPASRLTTVLHGLFFVAGFTFVFVSIGLLTTAFVNVIGGQNINTVTGIIGRLGGLVIIFFGFQFMGVMPVLFSRLLSSDSLLKNPLTSVIAALIGSAVIAWGFTGTIAIWDSAVWNFTPWAPAVALVLMASLLLWLVLGGAFTNTYTFWTRLLKTVQRGIYLDTRREMTRPGQQGFAGSALMGVVFSAGWTPCIGPVYGAVLTMAANGGSVAQAGLLLLVYSLGLGIPFMLTALMLDGAQGILRRLRSSMRRIELASGAFLVLIGVLVASGSLQQLSLQFSTQFADFSYSVEESVIDLFNASEGSEDAADEIVPAPEGQEQSGSTGTNSSLVLTNPETAQETPLSSASGQLPSIASLADTSGPVIGLNIGERAPVFETVSDSGQPVRLADLRGQVVLVNFWATWCGPCRVEMPAFESAYQAFADNGFTIVAVNNAEAPAVVQGFRAEMGLSFPLVMDQSGIIQGLYGIQQYPSTFLVDRDGTIIARHFGALNEAQLADMIGSVLDS